MKKNEISAEMQENGLITLISRAATDPNIDIDKMERLLSMHERMMDKQAEISFNKAMTELQMHLPDINEGGEIRHNGKLISKYARWDEDMHPVIRPILHEYGFSLSFRTNTENGVKVKAVLSHVEGHSEETEISLPSDVSGSKNNVQAVASSVSYGKRYTACSLLNIATAGIDDDGASACGQAISEDQVKHLDAKIKEVLGDDTQPFFTWMKKSLKVNTLSDLNQNGFDEVNRQLERKAKK